MTVPALCFLTGLALVLVGADLLVRGASRLASAVRVSPLVIGLTVVAYGTSMPELTVSVRAAAGGQADLAIGNVVGSNIFNLLAVLGLSASVARGGAPVPESVLAFDMPVMAATAIACLPIFLSGYRIDRWEGFLFLGYFAAYLLYLVLDATHSGAMGYYRAAMLGFVIPLTVLTLALVAMRVRRRR